MPIPASDLHVSNIDPAAIDALLPNFPHGFTTATGPGPQGGRLQKTPDEARAHVHTWLFAMEAVERAKREAPHPNQVRGQAMAIVEKLLTASGA